MVLIFGWGPGAPRDLGEIAPAICPNCHNQVFFHLVQSKKQFSLFFVPVVPYGTNEYLLCPICQHGLPVKNGQGSVIQQMHQRTVSYRNGRLIDGYLQAAADFWRQLGINPSGQQIVHAATQIPSPAVAGGTAAKTSTPTRPVELQLTNLARLHDQGVLTDDEFAAAKKKILGI